MHTLSHRAGRSSPHTPRLTRDGRWVCSGGKRTESGKPGCDFATPDYHEAVTHSTVYGGQAPDMPREMYA